MERLQSWNDGGNPRYRPSSYEDLKKLSVILIVCEKGKMRITYPSSLRWYDLRLRYSTLDNVTRGAIKQDFGRACRYHSKEELPTVLLSRKAYKKLFSRKKNGVCKLNPDYPKFMTTEEKTKKTFPKDDVELAPYKCWIAGKEHCDHENNKTHRNRYLLIGTPQVGKTGAFLHLAFLLWGNMPNREATRSVEQIEIIEELDDEEEEDATNISKKTSCRQTFHGIS